MGEERPWDKIVFVCIICERGVRKWWHKPDASESIEPVCRGCEMDYQKGTFRGGSIRDRRKVRQIGALAEALRGEAVRAEWPEHWKVVPHG